MSSIVARVARTYLVGLALAASCIVIASASFGALVVVWRDDEGAIAVGRTLATELEDHVDQPSSFDRVARHELAEQHWVARRIEIWLGPERLGAPTSEGALGSFATRPSGRCEMARIGGKSERVCVVRASVGASIVIASELAPMLGAMLPMVGVVALVALAVTILFGLLGRRALARNLAPLSRFEAEIAALPARARSRSVTQAWGSTEIDSLAGTFNAMLARIDEAIAREQRFVYDAAHELRTPLTRLRIQLELAQEEAREGKPVDARLVASIRTAVELADTTEALLAMAQNEMGASEPVELTDVVESILSRLEPSLRDRVRVTSTIGPIASAVEPLVVLEEDEGLVTIRVDDRGPGIAEDELARIREPFVRGSSSQGVRGAGLGLALADHVARLHGGALTLERRDAEGLSARLAIRRWRSAS
jgi:signal transduction histidine kinase